MLFWQALFNFCDFFSSDFTVAHIQKNGFSMPILVRDKAGLDIKVPKSDFTVRDVRQGVGKL